MKAMTIAYNIIEKSLTNNLNALPWPHTGFLPSIGTLI